MKVISQGGEIDVPYKIATIFKIGNTILARNDRTEFELAEYSTEAKAIKAMEMLREQYKRLETFKLYTKGSREDIREILTLDELGCTILKTRKLSVFQFPQDDEIEV